MAEDPVTQALQQARYQDLVQLNDSILSPAVSGACGLCGWQLISNELEPIYYLRTKKWTFPMLNDRPRNEAYRKAIEQISDCPGSILDIGTGTGLWGVLCARKFSLSQAFLIDMASGVLPIARETAVKDSNCVVSEAHSCEMPPLEPKASLCVSELLESGLLGEGWLPAMRDAWDRHLSPTATILPIRTRVYGQLVRTEWARGYRTSESSEGLGWELGNQRNWMDSDMRRIPIHADVLFRRKQLVAMSQPIELLVIDMRRDSIPGPEGQSRTNQLDTTTSGVADGILVWWELDLSDDIHYNPRGHFQDHWHSVLHLFRSSRSVDHNEPPSIHASHDDFRIHVNLVETNDQDTKRIRLDPWQAPFVSDERAYLLNQQDRTDLWIKWIRASLKDCPDGTISLDLSDYGWAGLLAAVHCGAKHVLSWETPPRAEAAARIAQVGNSLPTEGCKFEVLQGGDIQDLSPDTIGGSVGLVLAEPYYEVLEGWHVLEALNLYAWIRYRKEILAANYVCVPAKARVLAVAIESDHLFSAYSPLGSGNSQDVEGVDHRHVNDAGGNFHEYDVVLPMWQYDYKALTKPFELMALDYTNTSANEVTSCEEPLFTENGTCHAIMLWVEYGMENEWYAMDASPATKQMIRMLPQPTNAREQSKGVKVSMTVAAADNTESLFQLEVGVLGKLDE